MPSTTQTRSNESYDIQLAKPNQLPDVLRIMRENFYHEENMFRCLCSGVTINDDETKRINDCFDDWTKNGVANGPCLVAVCRETGTIVGINIVYVTKNSKMKNTGNTEAIVSSGEPGIPLLVEKYADYLGRMNNEAKLFDKYPDAEVIWEFYAIAIDKKHRRLGLAKDLMRAGINLARESKVYLVFGVFTSIHSAKSAVDVGMKSIMEFRLDEYRDEDGAFVFKETGVHNAVHVMVLTL